MRNQRLNLQITAMICLIVAAFFGNALFFSSLNADTLRASVEAETSLFSSLLADNITAHITREDFASGELIFSRDFS